MVKVEIVPSLEQEIYSYFKAESLDVLEHLKSLENSPAKGKTLGHVGGILIKELRYKGFRFYFITDANKLRIFSQASLSELLMRFVRMSDKKDQQKTIDEIKHILRKTDFSGF